MGPALPDVIAGIGSIVSLTVFLKFWKPKTVWHFAHEEPPTLMVKDKYTTGQIIRAWSPFILLTIMIIAWGMKPVKNLFDSFALIQFEFPGLHNVIMDRTGKALPHVFKFNWLSASGTAILLSAIISIPLIGLKFKDGVKIFFETLRQLRFPILTIASVLAFAYIVNDSGITITIAQALANTGFLFPFFAPVLGWLGVFITGSDTSANALFGKLQAVTATSIGVDPVVTVSANVSGGVVGKMISPQSIAVAAAAGHLVGKESELFRFTVKHSFILLFFICCLVLIQAYAVSWIIPKYQVITAATSSAIQNLSEGYIYLFGLIIALAALTLLIIIMNKKKKKVSEKEEALIT